jgi:methionyl-tRNA formyltransferase
MPMRAAFMGSPEFAVPSLHAVRRACDLQVVVCQPDRPAGRGRKLTAPAVKAEAEALGLPVLQPTKMKDGTLLAALREYDLDLAVVVAFGRILPPDLLALPRHGCINVHASALPRWRGAAPIQRAILAGDPETAVAIMQMDAGLDTGPVFRTVVTPIGPTETSGELFERLAGVGAEALEAFLRAFPDVPPATPQASEGMTLAPPLRKEEGRIDWNASVRQVVDHIRGMDPWPAAFASYEDAPLRMFTATPAESTQTASPGTIVAVTSAGVVVACADGAVNVAQVQPAGKRRMDAHAWAAGRRIGPGVRLG